MTWVACLLPGYLSVYVLGKCGGKGGVGSYIGNDYHGFIVFFLFRFCGFFYLEITVIYYARYI